MPPPDPTESDPAPSGGAGAVEPGKQAVEETTSEPSSGASMVAAGIFASRISGLIRERVIAYFFGVGAIADVWSVISRVPNILQNLLGEGTISAAFIPTYSRMIEDGRHETAGQFAGAIFGLLLATAAVIAGLGIVFARPIVMASAPGFIDDAARVAAGELSVNRFELAVDGIRIMFPMTGVLVLSAWALGVLNSHRRFFIPYVAPVLWNLAIMSALAGGALYWTGNLAVETYDLDTLTRLLLAGCGGALVGGVLQFGIQLPAVRQSMRGFRLSLSQQVEGVREAVRAAGPVIAGRGVAQISAFVDQIIGSLYLFAGGLSALRFGQILYMLPISLFGMSVTASELPELSRLTDERVEAFVSRLKRAFGQLAFLTVPTVVGYLGFGYLIVGALLRTGQFGAQDQWLVYMTLAAYTVGILATSMSRLLQNAFYAIGDTSTPARLAVVRVAVSVAVAFPAVFWFRQFSVPDVARQTFGGETLYLGAMAFGLGASVAAWLELAALLWRLRRTVPIEVPWGRILGMLGLSTVALGPALGLWWIVAGSPVLLAAPAVGGLFAAVYLGAAYGLGFSELDPWIQWFG